MTKKDTQIERRDREKNLCKENQGVITGSQKNMKHAFAINGKSLAFFFFRSPLVAASFREENNEFLNMRVYKCRDNQ